MDFDPIYFLFEFDISALWRRGDWADSRTNQLIVLAAPEAVAEIMASITNLTENHKVWECTMNNLELNWNDTVITLNTVWFLIVKCQPF